VKLTHEEIESIEDLSPSALKALKSLIGLCIQQMETDVLKCSIGRGDPAAERSLVVAKCQLEGGGRLETLLFKELQAIRKVADNRRPA
jgi:hypothetical protein